jgi:hypothetical protein
VYIYIYSILVANKCYWLAFIDALQILKISKSIPFFECLWVWYVETKLQVLVSYNEILLSLIGCCNIICEFWVTLQGYYCGTWSRVLSVHSTSLKKGGDSWPWLETCRKHKHSCWSLTDLERGMIRNGIQGEQRYGYVCNESANIFCECNSFTTAKLSNCGRFTYTFRLITVAFRVWLRVFEGRESRFFSLRFY